MTDVVEGVFADFFVDCVVFDPFDRTLTDDRPTDLKAPPGRFCSAPSP